MGKGEAPASVGDAWKYEADLSARDPNNLNDHLKVSWEEVLGEPDHTHSIDCVWTYSAKCFTMWKTLCYIIATAICGIPIATCWGCYFACVAFCHIWCVTPQIRDLMIECAINKKIMKVLCDTTLTPACDACGAVFNAFKK